MSENAVELELHRPFKKPCEDNHIFWFNSEGTDASSPQPFSNVGPDFTWQLLYANRVRGWQGAQALVLNLWHSKYQVCHRNYWDNDEPICKERKLVHPKSLRIDDNVSPLSAVSPNETGALSLFEAELFWSWQWQNCFWQNMADYF